MTRGSMARALGVAAALAGASAGGAPDSAQAQPAASVEVPAQPLPTALSALARQSGAQISAASDAVAGRTSGAVSGPLTVEAALDRMLAGTGLRWRRSGGDGYVVEPVPAAAEAGADAETLPMIMVEGAAGATGTRTIGAPPPPFAGGQVATGARLGVLGNREIFDAPVSVTPFTRDVIVNQQARTAAEVLRNDASVSVFQNANPSGTDDVYSIRGFLGASSNTSFDGLFGLNFRQPGLEQIERVELFKGPSSLFYGQAGFLTVGGNINFVPKRAGEEPLTELTGRYISDENLGLAVDVGRRFGEGGMFGARVNLAARDGETSVDRVEKRTLFGSAAFDARFEDVRVTLDLDASDFRTDGALGGTGIDPGFAVPDAPDGDNFWGSPDSVLTQEKLRGATRIEYDFAPGWTATAAAGQLNLDERFDFCGARIVNNAGDVLVDCYAGGSDVRNRAAEALVRGEFATGPATHRSSFGWSFNDSRFKSAFVDGPDTTSNLFRPTFPSAPGFPDFSIPGETSRSQTTTFFLNHELGLFGDRVLLLAGLRRTEILTRNRDGVTGAITSRYEDDDLTPGFGIVVKPLENVSLYANYVEALEPGGIAPNSAANAGEALAPLVADQIEAGVKADFGSVGVTFAAFEITRANAFIDPTTNIFGDDGEQVNRGLELSVFGEPMDGLRVLASAAYIDSELRRTAGGVNDGNDAIGVPELAGRLGVEWDAPWVDGLTLTGTAFYTSEQKVDQANTQEVDDWARLDLGARYAFPVDGREVTVRFNVENVTDEKYWSSVDRGFLYAGAGRTVLLSVTAAF